MTGLRDRRAARRLRAHRSQDIVIIYGQVTSRLIKKKSIGWRLFVTFHFLISALAQGLFSVVFKKLYKCMFF